MDESLTLKIFYPDTVSHDETDDYNAAFAFWYDIWLETRQEVDGTLATPSDGFSRQSEIMVLYCHGRPIATCCHRYVDLRHKCVIYDSYFTPSIWPDSVKEKVPTLGQTCLLGSYIYIAPEFRKRRSGLPIKNIVCALSLVHLNGTQPDVMLGMTRIDRGVHKIYHDSGAVSLHPNVSWYHVPIDLIALFPKKVPIKIDARYQEIVRSIGRTCDRFTANYFQRDRLLDGGHLNGGKSVARAADSFGRAW
jgi:hypothetical protein